MGIPFDKYILIAVLFAAFVGLANYWKYRIAPQQPGRLRYRRRRLRPRSTLDEQPQPEDSQAAPRPRASASLELESDAEALEADPLPLFSRWSPWVSVLALLVCLAALLLLWVGGYAAHSVLSQ